MCPSVWPQRYIAIRVHRPVTTTQLMCVRRRGERLTLRCETLRRTCGQVAELIKKQQDDKFQKVKALVDAKVRLWPGRTSRRAWLAPSLSRGWFGSESSESLDPTSRHMSTCRCACRTAWARWTWAEWWGFGLFGVRLRLLPSENRGLQNRLVGRCRFRAAPFRASDANQRQLSELGTMLRC